MIIRAVFLLLLTAFGYAASGQSRIDSLEIKLDALADSVPGLRQNVELSVDGASIQEVIAAIGKTHGINVTADPTLTALVYNNFQDVSAADVFLFLCSNYNLDIKFYGKILSFYNYYSPPVRKVVQPKDVNFLWNNGLATADLREDTLYQVAKKLTQLTGVNLTVTNAVRARLVSGYFQGLAVERLLDNLALSNDLALVKSDAGDFILDQPEKTEKGSVGSKANAFQTKGGGMPEGLSVKVTEPGKAVVQAVNVPLGELIKSVAYHLGASYFILGELKGAATLSVPAVSFEEFLVFAFRGTGYGFKRDQSVFLIGDETQPLFKNSKLIQLQNRSVEKVVDAIPSDIKKGLEIKEFGDLNSLIVSGADANIQALEIFLLSIDKIIPVVQIDVIILDVRNTRSVSTGIEAGLGDAPAETGGVLFPGADVTLNSSSINEIISGINGLGILNLGKVTPNFYLKLRALETQGYLKVRSTPKLATLNGNEASMSIGRTEYYLETSNNVIGNLNPQNIITQQYKSVTADLAVTVKPVVSGDEQITLNISVNQSSFTERISPSAPPGSINRDFKSLVRVKNGEMILLGGLEENSNSNTGSGTPVLSRVPVLKWLFSSRSASVGKNKLVVLIRPTVIY